ncbi:MAG: hypothetical protein WBD55_11045 [Dehalococcoidia bacterium]
MPLLSEILPGIRHVRATLVSGYLWLLFGWLVLQPDLRRRPDDALAAAAYDLAGYFGVFGVGIAASLAAFLSGAIALPLSAGLGIGWDWLYFRWYGNVVFEGFERTLSDVYHRALASASELKPTLSEQVHQDLLSEIEARSNAAFEDVERELDLPPTLLVGDHQALFSEVDRRKSDGEFRMALVPPLVALIALLAVSDNVAWFCLLFALLPLQWPGASMVRESRQLIADAMDYGQIESPSVRKFAAWVDDLPRFVTTLAERRDPPPGLEFR